MPTAQWNRVHLSVSGPDPLKNYSLQTEGRCGHGHVTREDAEACSFGGAAVVNDTDGELHFIAFGTPTGVKDGY